MSSFHRAWVFIGACLLSVAVVTAAQDEDCVAAFQSLMDSVKLVCSNSDVSVNQLCYGSEPLTILPRPNIRLDFSKPGDIVDLAAIQSVTTSPLNADDGTGGVAVMKVRANLPDSFVSMVAFGDVTLDNQSEAASDFIALPVSVAASQGANIRMAPNSSATQIGSLISGQVVPAIGRTEDSTWLLVVASGKTGWVSTRLLNGKFDFSILRVTAPDEHVLSLEYGTMQAFHFRSGWDDAPCTGVTDSGILVQNQGGSDGAVLEVNGARIVVTGTIFLQTQVTGETFLGVLEGQLSYNDGKKLDVGQRLQYGYQADVIQFAQPDDYNYVRARNLPLSLLPREIELPFSTGGVVMPFTPGTGFLNDIPSDAACTVAWAGDINLRAGPGTNYPLRQGVPGGYYAQPDARAVGTDGRVWWRLAEGIWISADTTVGAGSCGTLPTVEPPPLESG